MKIENICNCEPDDIPELHTHELLEHISKQIQQLIDVLPYDELYEIAKTAQKKI